MSGADAEDGTWADLVREALYATETRIDRWKARLGTTDPLEIVPYVGVGNRRRLLVKGRVLEAGNVRRSLETDRALENLVQIVRRFESDEVPGARLRLSFRGRDAEVSTDEEGYFEQWIELEEPLDGQRETEPVRAVLVSPTRDPAPTVEIPVVVPPPTARFLVLSDVDDTVVHTGATSLVTTIRNVLLQNARQRLPFPGISALYRALHSGATGGERNPVAYVSSSPWNLYDVLQEYLELQGLPVGALFLRDWGLSREELLPTRHGMHKRDVLLALLDLFPDLPAILLGDSGQEDPEIYRSILDERPGRIGAIYIRDVSDDPSRDEAVRLLAGEAVGVGVPFLVSPDAAPPARHAAEAGWIPPAAVAAVEAEVSEATDP